MLKFFLTRSLFAAFAVISLFAASSALGARTSHSERARAGAHRARVVVHRKSRAHKAAHRTHHKRVTAPTPTPPVNPSPPLEPVSPVEPTPPITPVLPVEPVTPPVTPTPPVEPVTPVTPTPPVEPAPAPPAASFTFTPASPVTGQAVAFDGAGSSCADGPCTYEWSDDGGATRPIPALWPLGTGRNLSFTFAEVGTKYVRLVVTDAAGRTATIEHNVVVAAPTPPPPPPPSAPANTSPPVVSGTTVEGQALSASAGSWSGSPTYAYQWQDCNSSGKSCANISGATTSKRTLAASDVGHTMRVMVTATNSGGATSMGSSTTATVTAPVVTPPPSEPPATEPPPTEPPSTQTGCFSAPGACGYPDPNYGNVGPSAACSSLTPSGNLDAGTAGETIQNMDITGEVTVSAKNVTITNDCISSDGGGTLGSRAVTIAKGVTGTQITHSNIGGANSTGQSVEEALSNNYANADTVADHDYIHNCGECVHGAWTLTNSYVIVNGTVPNCGSECPDHYEDIYCDSSTFVAEHDVLLNPEGQTAALFCDTSGGSGGPALNHITLTDSLVGGGGFTLYPQGNSDSVGSSTMDISGNRFARCKTAPVFEAEWGTTSCKGGADSHGYWPLGGNYGVASYIYCPPTSGQVWSGNVWDDNNETVGC
jgi:hypothetical protein